MSQSLSNQNTNSQSMNGLITVNANTITTQSIQTDTIDIKNSGTLDIIPPLPNNDINSKVLINAGWVNQKINDGVYVNLTTDQTILSGVKTFNQHINVGDISYGYGATTGVGNVAIGNSNTLLHATTSSSGNVGIGLNALKENTSGINNIGLGFNAIQYNTTSNNNIGIGEGATLNVLLGDNIGLGQGTIQTYQNASGNIGIGTQAGTFTNSSVGNNNIYLGFSCCVNKQTDTNDSISVGANIINSGDNGAICIGANSNISNTNSCAIGYNVSTDADNQFKLGRSDQNVKIDGTLEIGTSGTLDVIPSQTTSLTSNILINAGWANTKLAVNPISGSALSQTHYLNLFRYSTANVPLSNYVAYNASNNLNLRYTPSNGLLENYSLKLYGASSINDLVFWNGKTANLGNIAVGTLNTLLNTTTGTNNISLGAGSSQNIFTGSSNVVIGYNSNNVSTNTDTSNVVSIGANSFVKTSNSIAIGNSAVVDTGHTNSCAIGNSVITTAANQFKLGRSDQNVIIDGTLTVSGEITGNTTIVSNDFNARTITGSNNLFNNTTTGAIQIATNLSGAGSVVVGNATTQANNTFYGTSILASSTTTIIGNDTATSLFDCILYATNNNFSGAFTPKTNAFLKYEPNSQTLSTTKLLLNGTGILSSPSSTQYNFSFGDSTTMANCSSGYWNTAIGQNSLQNLVNGAGNICLGYNTGNSVVNNTDNIFMGYSSGSSVSTGNGNIALGAGSSTVNISGSNNVVLGTSAQSTSGIGSQSSVISIGASSQVYTDNSIAIGNSASVNSGHTNSIAIGYNSATTASNQIQLGTTQNVNCASLTTGTINTNQTSNEIVTNASLTIYSKLISNTSSFLSASLATAPSSVCLSADGTRQYFVSGQFIYGGSVLQQPGGGTSGITYQAQNTSLTGVWNGKGAISCSYDGRIVLVGRTTGSIYLSFDFGYSFSNISVITGVGATSLATSMNSDGKSMIVVNQAGTVFYSNNFGTTWTSGSSVSNYPTIISAGYTNSSSITGDTERYVIISAGNTTPSATFIQLITHTIGGGITLTLQTSSGAGSKIWTWAAFLNNTCIATSTDGVYTTTNTSGNTGWTNPITGTGYIGATIHTNNNPNNLFYLLNSTTLQTWDGTNTPTNSTFGILPTYLSGGDRTGRAISFLIGTQNGCILNQPLSNLKSQLLINNNSLNYANLVIPYKNAQISSSPCQLYFPLAENYQILITGALTINLPYVTAANCGVKCWFYSLTARTINMIYTPATGNYLQDFNLAPLAINANLTSSSFAKCFLSSAIISGSNVAYGWVCISNA